MFNDRSSYPKAQVLVLFDRMIKGFWKSIFTDFMATYLHKNLLMIERIAKRSRDLFMFGAYELCTHSTRLGRTLYLHYNKSNICKIQ